MNIYLVRHGETVSNVSGAYCGITDVPLTDKGFEQTKKTAEYLRCIKADRIYSSPLSRARNLSDMIGENIIFDKHICERNFGIWEGLLYEDICSKYPAEVQCWNDDWINYRISGGESCADVEKRCRSFLDDILNSNTDCIVVTHSGIIRNIITLLFSMKTEDVWRFKIDNGSVTHIQITDGYAVLCSLNYIP